MNKYYAVDPPFVTIIHIFGHMPHHDVDMRPMAKKTILL